MTELSGPPLFELDALGHMSKIRSLAFTRDGRSLVSARYDKTVRVCRCKRVSLTAGKTPSAPGCFQLWDANLGNSGHEG